jgi:hypothetical protein
MKTPSKPRPSTWYEGIARPVLLLNRLARIAVVTLGTLILAMVVMPLVDLIYLTYFYDPATTAVPAWIIAITAVIWYGAGWILIVGSSGRPPAPRPATAVYLLAAGAMLIVMLILVVSGAVDALRV